MWDECERCRTTVINHTTTFYGKHVCLECALFLTGDDVTCIYCRRRPSEEGYVACLDCALRQCPRRQTTVCADCGTRAIRGPVYYFKDIYYCKHCILYHFAFDDPINANLETSYT